MKYDYLIVGSGLTGAVFAHEALKRGKTCLVIEKRSHIGGNAYDIIQYGILLHRYGAHIFHTKNKKIWDYVRQFGDFNHFVNSPIANYHGELYNLPFNMNTFHQLWGVVTPDQAYAQIECERVDFGYIPQNVEEQALSLVGRTVYEKLIRSYTEKQWRRPCCELPAFILKRIPLRFVYDNNYFDDPYQGIPVLGYTVMIENMLQGCDIHLNTDFFEDRRKFKTMATKIFYTGMIDAYFEYIFGPLAYRSLRFEDTCYDIENYQGVAVMNYTDIQTPFTRSIEHKHFQFGSQTKTIVTREFPVSWKIGTEPYYPVNDAENQILYQRYHALAQQETNVMFCGRLAEYRYYNMDQAVASALSAVQAEFDC